MADQAAFDRAVGLILLLACMPLFVFAAVSIKLDDGGPVIFRQKRVGKGGRPFAIYKFRTMMIDAETRRTELAARNECDSVLFKMHEDPRITPVGIVAAALVAR